MTTHKGIIQLILSLVSAFVLLVLAATFSTSVQAGTAEGYKAAAPVQLAWWYGPGYGHGYYHCGRVCWRDRWGYRHCARRC